MNCAAFRAAPWLPGGHAQTIWPRFMRRAAQNLQRLRWEWDDGDFIDVDHCIAFPGAPLVVMFHGLEGSSRSHYASALFAALHRHGWNGALPHFRGCSGTPNRLLRAYHSGDADEIERILLRFRTLYPDIPLHALGISLGGNALLLWLGRQGRAAQKIIASAAAISAPLDLTIAGHHLARGFNRLYTAHFLHTMRRNAAYKAQLFPGSFDAARAVEAKTLYEFDDAYTAPVHGFRNADDYWQRASSKPYLRAIQVPCLVINARNDPFLPAHALPTKQEVSQWVHLEQPHSGGHVGFVQGAFPGHIEWLPWRVLQFFTAQT